MRPRELKIDEMHVFNVVVVTPKHTIQSNSHLGCKNKGSLLPQSSPEPEPHSARIQSGYRAMRLLAGHCYRHNTHVIPIVAGNVISAPHRTARMASKHLVNPMRRAVAQRARPTSANVCFQCQQRWQSKVSQRPGSDR
jgi:hypothetical protein